MQPEGVEELQDTIRQGVENVIEEFASKIIDENDFKNVSYWINLLSQIMSYIQRSMKLPGLKKMEIALTSIESIVKMLLEKNVGNLNDETIATLNLIISSDGMNILAGSTSMIKQFMNRLDSNNDGEISAEECSSIFPCCFPGLKKKK